MFQDRLEGHVKCQQPTIPFYSTVSGGRIDETNGLNPSYWRQNLESRVLFHTAIRSLLEQEPVNRLFVEIGPHSALGGPLKQIFKAHKSQNSYVPTLIRDEHSTKCLLTTAGRLHLNNIPMDFSALNPHGEVLTDLPIYPWHHKTGYWDESRPSKEFRLRKFSRHEILGSRILEGNDMEPTWRNVLHLDEVPWINDHKIYDDVVFPAAGYIAMAIEAISQISGIKEGFDFRHIDVNRALLIGKSMTVETMTSLRPVRLTKSLDSSWYEFSVFSHSGGKWEKHCTGEIKGSMEQMSSTSPLVLESRTISAPHWYQILREAGLNYRGAFEGLTDISAGIVEKAASASIIPCQGSYPVHPTTIDMCLQLFSVATSYGIVRRFDRVFVPTSIESLKVRQSISKLQVQAFTVSSSRKMINGSATAKTEDQRLVISMRGVNLSPLETSKAPGNFDTDSAARLEWRPCLDLLSPADLIPPSAKKRSARLLCERMTILCIIETSHRLRMLETPLKYLNKYRSWLEVQTTRAQEGKYDLIEDAQEMTRMTSVERLALILDVSREAKSTNATALATVIIRIFESAEGIFKGNTQALELLMQGTMLEKLYDWLVGDWKSFLRLLSHRKPDLKILEVGAGTGGTTASVLESLISTSGQPMYSKFTYTDVSLGFLSAAKERFGHAPKMDYAVLDISKDPVQQGFVAGSYDLILAANVLHATPKISDTLLNVKKLLHPRGRLLLQELSPTMRCINYIMGVLPGWWLGEQDGRYLEPHLPLEKWDTELWNAGFQGADTGIHDDEIPYQINMSIVSTIPPRFEHTRKVSLLCEEQTPAVDHIHRIFMEKGYAVDRRYLHEQPPDDREVISVLDLDKAFLFDIAAGKLQSFKQYMGKLKRGILWVTHSVHVDCKDPAYGMIFGVARTMRSELSIDIATFEIDDMGADTWTTLLQVFETFQRRDKNSDMDPDYEYALAKGTVYIGRYHWLSVNQELSDLERRQEGRLKTLEVGTYGLLHTLQWGKVRPHILADEEVVVEIKAIGTNIRDLFIIMGQGEETDEGLGSDGSGIVRQIGSQVTDLCLGDRVFVLAKGCFSTFLKCSASQCAKIPSGMSFEDAATMPSVYCTVIYSLIDIGRLEQGQVSVLCVAAQGCSY